MKFTTASIVSTLLAAACATPVPSLFNPDLEYHGPLALKLSSSNPKYDGKYLALTGIKPSVTLLTLSSSITLPVGFTTGNGNIMAASPNLVRGAPHETFETAFKTPSSSSKQLIYFVTPDWFKNFGPNGIQSSVEGYKLQDGFELDAGKITYNGSKDAFWVCGGVTVEETGSTKYDAVVVGAGAEGCERVVVGIEMIKK